VSLKIFRGLVVFTLTICVAAQRPASSASSFSLSIRPMQDSPVKASSTIEVECTMTNTSNHLLHPFRTTNPGEYYLFDVRRDGAPVTDTEALKHMKKLGRPRPEKENSPVPYTTSAMFTSLAPRESLEDTVPVSEYFEMSQPGRYTIQLGQGKVKSNTVTVTVIP